MAESCGRKGLARARRHLDEGTIVVLGEGGFEFAHRFDLAVAQAVLDKRRHDQELGALRLRLANPSCERFGSVERKDPTGRRIGIGMIAKQHFDARGDVFETHLTVRANQMVRHVLDIASCLIGKPRQCHTIGFGLDHATELSLHKESVIDRTGRRLEFADCDTTTYAEVHLFPG